MNQTVMAQLRHMKRPLAFTVVPMSDGRILVVSKRGVGAFDYRTGKGKFTAIGDDVSALINALPYDFPPQFVVDCLNVCPSLGGTTEYLPGVQTPHTYPVSKNSLI